MRIPLDILYVLAGVLYLPVLAFGRLVRGKRRGGWAERFGRIRPRWGDQPCLWVHGVSMGEVNATRSLIEQIERRLPMFEVVVSATTDTGFGRARSLYPGKKVFRYPLDFSWVVRRVLARIRPSAIVLMELEVWPNLLAEASRRGVPVAVVNGRLTKRKSMRRFGLPGVRAVARRMFAQLAWVGAQDEVYARRFEALGVPPDRVQVTGSLKFDGATVADTVDGQDALAAALGLAGDAPLWVAGSTGPGEEAIVLDAWQQLREGRPDVQLAVIPRKPERFDEVARLVASRGFACVRRSQHPDGSEPPAATEPRVLLGDTMGELRKFYALADVVFVGRSLVDLGGSDMIEVAALGKVPLLGPHTFNFDSAVRALLAADGTVEVTDADTLAAAVGRLLEDPGERRGRNAAARQVVVGHRGATDRTVDALCELLGYRADHPPAGIATPKLADLEAATP